MSFLKLINVALLQVLSVFVSMFVYIDEITYILFLYSCFSLYTFSLLCLLCICIEHYLDDGVVGIDCLRVHFMALKLYDSGM